MREYRRSDSDGVYSNRYGSNHCWYYLVTKDEKICPLPPLGYGIRVTKWEDGFLNCMRESPWSPAGAAGDGCHRGDDDSKSLPPPRLLHRHHRQRPRATAHTTMPTPDELPTATAMGTGAKPTNANEDASICMTPNPATHHSDKEKAHRRNGTSLQHEGRGRHPRVGCTRQHCGWNRRRGGR